MLRGLRCAAYCRGVRWLDGPRSNEIMRRPRLRQSPYEGAAGNNARQAVPSARRGRQQRAAVCDVRLRYPHKRRAARLGMCRAIISCRGRHLHYRGCALRCAAPGVSTTCAVTRYAPEAPPQRTTPSPGGAARRTSTDCAECHVAAQQPLPAASATRCDPPLRSADTHRRSTPARRAHSDAQCTADTHTHTHIYIYIRPAACYSLACGHCSAASMRVSRGAMVCGDWAACPASAVRTHYVAAAGVEYHNATTAEVGAGCAVLCCARLYYASAKRWRSE